MKYGLEKDQYKLLEDLVITPLKKQKAKVWIFGSRAKGTHKPFSDVDLLYEVESLPKGFIYQISSDLEESHFRYKMDLVSRKEIASSYKEDIENSKIEL